MDVVGDYYRNDAVRARMVEFLGGTFLPDATCVYLTDSPGDSDSTPTPLAPSTLPALLAQNREVSRSLWDRKRLLAHLDVEYVNFDYPGEAYLHPARVFELQQPTVDAIQRVLLGHGIAPLHLITGRGHHFVWSIDRGAPAFRRLAELAHLPDTLRDAYHSPRGPNAETIGDTTGEAFAGLGMLMEYLAHRIQQEATAESRLAVQITDVEVGRSEKSPNSREIISADVSEYADPLHTRHIRLPFSTYLKPHRSRELLGEHVVDATPTLFEIPAFELSLVDAIDVMRDAKAAAQLARKASVRIPDQSAGTMTLLARYQQSPLARFHQWFYSREQHPPHEWPQTYDRVESDRLPPCAAQILNHPNDRLLKPAGIQHIVRVFLSLGWHPRHIAGLIRSKYERDHGWGKRWYCRDATNRADWYTRLFAGLVVTGLDGLTDFNCVSHREKGYCDRTECGHNLADSRDSLLERKRHERLGCWPFNRLFFPHQHL